MEQLGSDQLAVRLGALYDLERLAADSEIDRATIYDVMCAWIRFRSVERDSAGAPITDGEVRQKPVVGEEIDYRAAITIVLRARPEWRINRRDLSGAVITNIVLSQTTLRGVRLGGSYLTDVNFIDIKLENIWLNEATLVTCPGNTG